MKIFKLIEEYSKGYSIHSHKYKRLDLRKYNNPKKTIILPELDRRTKLERLREHAKNLDEARDADRAIILPGHLYEARKSIPETLRYKKAQRHIRVTRDTDYK